MHQTGSLGLEPHTDVLVTGENVLKLLILQPQSQVTQVEAPRRPGHENSFFVDTIRSEFCNDALCITRSSVHIVGPGEGRITQIF